MGRRGACGQWCEPTIEGGVCIDLRRWGRPTFANPTYGETGGGVAPQRGRGATAVTAADGTKTRPPGVNDGRTDTRARPGWKALLFNTSHGGPGEVEWAGLGTVPGTTNAGTRDGLVPAALSGSRRTWTKGGEPRSCRVRSAAAARTLRREGTRPAATLHSSHQFTQVAVRAQRSSFKRRRAPSTSCTHAHKKIKCPRARG